MAAWANSERQWITLSNTNNFELTRSRQNLDPPASFDSSNAQDVFINVLEKVISRTQDSAEAAQAIATTTCCQEQPDDAWNDFLNILISAAMHFSEHAILKRLAHLLVEVAHQPDARNETGDTVIVEQKTSKDPKSIAPNGFIELRGGRLFSQLPYFGLAMREIWNGSMGPRWGSRAAAREAWVNVNAFLAHLVRSQSDDPITVLAIWPGDFGLWTITDGLEEPNGVNDHGIAAMNWLLVLGDIIHADPKWGGKPGRQTEGPVREGALWQAEQAKGASQYGRWAFWKRRVNGIAEDDAFDPAVRDTAKRTHHHMERFR